MAVVLIKPHRFGDERGWFSETFNARRFREEVADVQFCQDNHSMSASAGVLRGLHFQTPPHGQAKLVSCVRGSIWDVCVDVRHGSPTFGGWVAATLSEHNGHQLFVPVGFAHGFVTLEANTQVLYKVDDYYAPGCEGGIAWNDPDLNLPWPLGSAEPQLSAKDREQQSLAAFESPFAYDGRPLQRLASEE